MKLRKFAACAAAVLCAAAITVPSAAVLTTVPTTKWVISSEKMYLVMVYSNGTKDADTKGVTNYGIDLTKIASVDVTVKADVKKAALGNSNAGTFKNNWGGALVMSSVGDNYNHNWNGKDFWGVNDPDVGYEAAADKPVKFNKVEDGIYKATLTLGDDDNIQADCTFCQFAIQDWGEDTATVLSIEMKDASGNVLISYDENGKANLEQKPIEEKPAAEETTTEGTAEETKAEEAKPEDTTAAEETKAEEATEEPTEEYVSTFDPSSVKLNDTITDKYFDNGYLYLRDENGLDALDKGEGLDIMTVYGVRFILDYDEKDIENGIWFGGGIGANSNSTGWKQFGWSNIEGDQDLSLDLNAKSITWLSDAPVFAADDTYCQLWIQNWGGNWGVKEAQLLDKDGNVISFEGNAAAAEETTAAEPTPVDETASGVDAGTATAGDTTAATNSSKGSPNTGIADVAAIAGIAVAAAGAVVLTKKRK